MSKFVKANVIVDQVARELWLMGCDHHDRCQICHKPWRRSGWRGLVIHHIIHGANGRSDEPCNFLLVCGRCHDMIHDGSYRDERTKELLPGITLGHVLWIKSQTLEWNPERLTELCHRALPTLEQLPDYYLEERCVWEQVR